jgi:predicted S18 family serine protease
VYNDTSASLLVCLKVIGDVLDMEIDPHTVVSGEVDESGKILPVACLAEKVLAAQRHPEIRHMLLPIDGLFMTSRRIEIIGVHNLSEAVAYYYGEQFQKKLKQSRRKQELGRVIGVIAAPFAVSIVKDLFLTSPNPVTDRDRRLIGDAKDLYQKEGKYRFAVDILDSLIVRFQRQDSATEALRLKAQAWDI